MKTQKIKLLALAAISMLMLNACNLPLSTSPTPSGDVYLTEVAKTLVAQLTEMVQPTATSPANLPSSTATLLPPTNTLVPTNTPIPTRTPIPVPCDWAQFITDVTVSDGSIFTPGAKFTKVWRLKNIGTCTWTADYDLDFVSGDGMNAPAHIALEANVYPGQSVDLAVKLAAPLDSGDYRGYWKLRNANSIVFGLGSDANSPFWVDIRVLELNDDYAYDFATNYCAATWRTAVTKLSCPTSNTDSKKGYVIYQTDPELENRTENEPTLIAHPDFNIGGWISGTYPTYKVKDGDHFLAWVGCLEDSDGCDVVFKLAYQIDGGTVETLGEWQEVYDGLVTQIDLDLSDLAGEKVRFILSVVVNGGKAKHANAFWFLPHIERE